jgi:hypothetical protein
VMVMIGQSYCWAVMVMIGQSYCVAVMVMIGQLDKIHKVSFVLD